DEAVAHARGVLALEGRLGLDLEHTVQSATFAGAPWLGHAATHVYVWGYFPVLVAAAAWLYLRHREGYRTLRAALVVSGVLGMLVYALYPVAPPWISDDRFADTVADASLDVFVRPGPFMNELGAIPSFHCGWLTLAAVVVFRATRSRALRVLCVTLPLAMYVSVVVTGNHWTLDVPAGLAVAALGLFGASRLRAARHPAGAGSPG
ncbi:MAG TPA: phosphatase PAP2 family protein, partial [Ornithinibacter sp.]|nr:phosphatase PAP2 family protein [Ornithinibacter sp.]